MLDPYLIEVESVRTTHCCVHIVVFGNGRTEAGDTWPSLLVVRRQSTGEMVLWIAVSMPGCWLAVDPSPRIAKSMAHEMPVARRRRSANCMIFATEQSSRGCYARCCPIHLQSRELSPLYHDRGFMFEYTDRSLARHRPLVDVYQNVEQTMFVLVQIPLSRCMSTVSRRQSRDL